MLLLILLPKEEARGRDSGILAGSDWEGVLRALILYLLFLLIAFLLYEKYWDEYGEE